MQKRLFGAVGGGVVFARRAVAPPSSSTAAAAARRRSATPLPADRPRRKHRPAPELDRDPTTSRRARRQQGGNLVVRRSPVTPTICTRLRRIRHRHRGRRPGPLGLLDNTYDLKYYASSHRRADDEQRRRRRERLGKMDVKIDLIRGAASGPTASRSPAPTSSYMWQWIHRPGPHGPRPGHRGLEDITSIDGGTGTQLRRPLQDRVYEQYLGLSRRCFRRTTSRPSRSRTRRPSCTPCQPRTVASGVYSGPYIPTRWARGRADRLTPEPEVLERRSRTADRAVRALDLQVLRGHRWEIAGFANGEFDVALEFNQNHLAAMTAHRPGAHGQGPRALTYEQHSWNMASLTEEVR